jgi:aryl-alcohol dehydrogenase-like predicted oxidoreductase
MVFEGDDLRNVDPKFKEPRYSQYLEAVEKLKTLAETSHDVSLLEFAVRWILDKGVDVALWGARRPDQLVPAEGVFGWNISDEEMRTVDNIIRDTITDPAGPEFMGPPARSG